MVYGLPLFSGPSRLKSDPTVRRGLINNVTIRSVWGDGVQVAPGGTWDADGVGAVISENVTIQWSRIRTAGRHGISSNAVKNFSITDNSISNIGLWGVDLEVEAKTWTADVRLLRNHFSNMLLGVLAVSPNAAPSTLGRIVANYNTRLDAPVYCMTGIVVGNRSLPPPSGVTVVGNRLHVTGGGVLVEATPFADVRRNTITAHTGVCAGPSIGVEFERRRREDRAKYGPRCA